MRTICPGVLVEAADGYQVVFSIPGIHPGLGSRKVLLANRVNGEPLSEKLAPYQVIVPCSSRNGSKSRNCSLNCGIAIRPTRRSPLFAT